MPGIFPHLSFFTTKLWSQLRWAHIAIDKQLRGVANALPKLGQMLSPTVFDICGGEEFICCRSKCAKIWQRQFGRAIWGISFFRRRGANELLWVLPYFVFKGIFSD